MNLWDRQRLLLRPEELVIIDAGANEGQSVSAYRSWWPTAVVHCFEPDPRAFAVLKASWGGIENVHLHQAALGSVHTTGTLQMGKESFTSSLLHRPKEYDGTLPMVGEVDVPLLTLDRVCEASSLKHVNLLKMDLQGGELAALRGAEMLLADEAIDLIYTEVWLKPAYTTAPHYWEIAEYLARFDYKTWWIEVTEYPDKTEGRWGNAVFSSRRYSPQLGY
jgi:FkbM family methyltransferase